MNENSKITDREAEARRILERVAQESETVGTSSTKRVAERIKDHLNANDVGKNDFGENEWAELWGTRIGRILGAVFVAFLILYLLRTYVFQV